MIRTWLLSFALIITGPGFAFAGTPIAARIAPVSPAVGAHFSPALVQDWTNSLVGLFNSPTPDLAALRPIASSLKAVDFNAPKIRESLAPIFATVESQTRTLLTNAPAERAAAANPAVAAQLAALDLLSDFQSAKTRKQVAERFRAYQAALSSEEQAKLRGMLAMLNAKSTLKALGRTAETDASETPAVDVDGMAFGSSRKIALRPAGTALDGQPSLEEASEHALAESYRRDDPRFDFTALSADPLSVEPLSGTPLSAARAPAPTYKEGDTFTVQMKNVEFDDADTVTVRHKGKKVTIRFGGVDAPEIAHPGIPGQPQTAQPYGVEAAAFLQQLILRGKSLTITVAAMDMYGRVVGGLDLNLPNGKTLDVQQELVRAGWAWQYVFYNSDRKLERLQAEAQAARRGLWQGLDVGGEHWPEAPWVFRRREKAGIARILPGNMFKHMVDHMPDADTIRYIRAQSVYGSLRLAGVDAPEVAHGGSKEQPFGVLAAARARELLMGKTATFTVQDTDKYGRLVVWVEFRIGAVWHNYHEVLLKEGWAWWYKAYYPEYTNLGKLEKIAREARRGLWQGIGRRDHMPPWKWRDKQKKNRKNKPPLMG